MSQIILNYLKTLGYNCVDNAQYQTVKQNLSWYQGHVKGFHDYTMRVGTNPKQLSRYHLCMAKTICEDYGSLLLNENTSIVAPGFEGLNEILQRNSFYQKANQLVEWTMALGTGATVEFLDENGQIVIDFIRADMVFPLDYSNERVQSCAFASKKTFFSQGKQIDGYYLQLHVKQNEGYTITNIFLNEYGKKMPLPKGVTETTPPTKLPMFQLLYTNSVNALYPDSPLGASVFGMAHDLLKACDLVFDSYVNEFVLGKKRVLVPQSLASIQMQKNGTMQPVFDPSDVLIYVYEQSPDGSQDIKPLDMALRATEHEIALQRMLDLLSKKCGLGVGRYHFDGTAKKTATEVISMQSDLYQSIKRHEKPLHYSLKQMVNSLSYLAGQEIQGEVIIKGDDSIFEDTLSTTKRILSLVSSGLKSKQSAICQLEGCTKEMAQMELLQINSEKN